MDVCRQVVPVEVRYPDGVRVACHLYPPGGEAVEVPTPTAWSPPGTSAGTPGTLADAPAASAVPAGGDAMAGPTDDEAVA